MIPTVVKERILLAVIGLAAVCSTVQVQGLTWEQTAWRSALYYRTTFEAPEAGEGLLHIAAADSFAAYFNGELVGSDSSVVQPRVFAVPVVRGDNHIAALVVNRGRGRGNGLAATLAVEFAAGDTSIVQTTIDRTRQPWYWSAQLQADDGWTTAEVARDEAWHLVQEGTLDPALSIGQPIAGFLGGTDIGSLAGGIILKQVRGQNLARDRVSNRPEVLDGDLNTSWNPPINALNFNADIDLGTRRKIHAVRVLTRGRNQEQYFDRSLRGYSIQVSDDQIRWTEVAILRDIVDFIRTEVGFPSLWTRHLRLVVVDINAVTQPNVAEIEVYGSLHAERGTFTSAPLDLGAPAVVKNVGRVRWQATVPAGTELTVQFRRADLADSAGGWSPPLTTGNIWFPAEEPGELVQYRVNMATRSPEKAPVFEHLEIDFDADQVPVSKAWGRIAPNRVPMGRDTAFTYTLDVEFADADAGLAQICIDVPAPAMLEEVAGLEGSALETWDSTRDQLTISLAEPLRQDTQLQIRFRTRTHAAIHAFRARLFAPNSDNPLNAAENAAIDPQSNAPYSWVLSAATSEARALSQVRVHPPVFSPNADGINDVATIEFVLSKVKTPQQVDIRIFDLSGRLVRDLRPPPLSAGAYVRLSTDSRPPGLWDGRNATGSRVAPGLYLYRVEVEVDTGAERAAGVVGVAY